MNADGIRVDPLYNQQPGPRAARALVAPWLVQARVDHPDAVTANIQALEDLAHGATGLTLVFHDHASAHGFGIAAANLPEVLPGVQLHAIALRLEGGEDAAKALLRASRSIPQGLMFHLD